jgi:hypothetical protein
MDSKPKPVLVTLSILAALQAFFLLGEVGDLIGENLRLLIIGGLGAVNVGIGFYLTGKVTPTANVVAYQPDTSSPKIIVAGGAAEAPTGERVSNATPVGAMIPN